MTEKPKEEKSREIEETVERYAANRWRCWVPALVLLPALLVWAAVVAAVARLVGVLQVGPKMGADLAMSLGLLLLFVGTVGAGVLAFYLRRWADRFGVSDSRVVPMSRPTCGPWESARIATATVLLVCLAFIGMGAFPDRFQPVILAIALTAPVACSAAADRWCDRDPLWRRIPVWTGLVVLYDLYALGAVMGMPQLGGESEAPAYHVIIVLLLLVLNALLGPLYGHLQFRHLQRLVNEDPPAEGNHGTD